MNLTTECKYIIVDIQLKEDSDLNEFGFEGEHIFNHDFFNPNHHIPPTNTTHNLNIFRVTSELFSATKSMQNPQVLTQKNG